MTTLPRIFEGLAKAEVEHREFELCDPAESDDHIEAWLGALPGDGGRLINFAQDGTGSLFCLWLPPGHDDVETAPVVFLGSEGELAVLAKEPAAFLEIVASGMTFNGYDGSFFAEDGDDEDEAEDEAAWREQIVAWVKRRTGKATLREPEAVKAEAEAAYPGFAAWVEANNAR